MPRSLIEVEAQILQLENALQKVGLWSNKLPNSNALKSQAPFACDQLSFEQWLQFIFIPKLREHLSLNITLPNEMGLLPMGEQSFNDPVIRVILLPILAKFDLIFKV
jgi:uncharacterized protein YqcC (DUF446 family)